MESKRSNTALRTLLSSVGLGFLISGCHSKPNYSSVLADLQQHGFLAHFTEAETEACTNIVHARGWDALYDQHPRFYWADAENLTECGVADFITSLKPFLDRVGVTYAISDNWGDHVYTVTLNGEERLIWSQAELKVEREGKPGLTWGLSTVRAFALVNELLEAAETNERLYAINGGNDLAAIFLTPELKDVVCASSGFRQVDLPYTPIESDDGWYGQPH
ncbi:MAG: hypothetical protein R3C53_28580 [Pirellulaceae bacterium]